MAKTPVAGLYTSNQGSVTGTRSRLLYSGRGRGRHQSGIELCANSVEETRRMQAKRPATLPPRVLPAEALGFAFAWTAEAAVATWSVMASSPPALAWRVACCGCGGC